MKKFLAVLLILLAMVFTFAACGGNNGGGDEGPAAVSVEDEVKQAEIRQAISLLFDRNYICEEIGQAGQVPANTFVAMGMTDADGSQFYLNSNGGEGYYSVDPGAFEANVAEAIEILKKYYEWDESAQKFTNFPTLHYLYNTSEGHKAIGEYLQSALASVGITMDMENQEWNTFLNTRKAGDYSIARNGWIADYNDPICFLDMWTSGSGNNDVQFGKGNHANLAMYNVDTTDLGLDLKVENGTWAETYDPLITLIKSTSDDATRYALMHKAEDLLMSTGAICPIYYYTDPYMISNTVDGFFANPLGYKYFMYTTTTDNLDTLNVCIASEPDTLDPAANSAVDGATMLAHLFSGLAKWSQDENGVLQIVPDAAEELVEGVPNEDGTTTYTYTIRDMVWSDGQPVTAGDFEFAWKRAANENNGFDYGYMFENVAGYPNDLQVTALDDKTLEVVLANDAPYWNELLAFPTFFPVREDVVADEGWNTDPSTYVCNGMYTMSAWEHNSVITLTKNENHPDAAEVTMPTLKFYLSDDANNMLTNFKNGEWKLIDDVPTNEMAALKKDYPDEFVVAGQIGTYYVCWNINEDIRVW